MQADEVFAILLQKIKLGGGSTADIQNAVNNYLNANPIQPGATTEQAKQIEENKTAIEQLKKDVENLQESGGGDGDGDSNETNVPNIDFSEYFKPGGGDGDSNETDIPSIDFSEYFKQ